MKNLPQSIYRFGKKGSGGLDSLAVSYTHLDVYKRQVVHRGIQGGMQEDLARKKVFT